MSHLICAVSFRAEIRLDKLNRVNEIAAFAEAQLADKLDRVNESAAFAKTHLMAASFNPPPTPVDAKAMVDDATLVAATGVRVATPSARATQHSRRAVIKEAATAVAGAATLVLSQSAASAESKLEDGSALPDGAKQLNQLQVNPRFVSVRDLPTRGEDNDPFEHNLWKRRMLERYAKMHEDVLHAFSRSDTEGVEQACRVLEIRNGQSKPARSKDLVGIWTMHWHAGHKSMESLDLFGPGGVSYITNDREVKDPFLDVGSLYRVDVAGVTGEVEPISNTTLLFRNLDGAVPAMLTCTYLDERMWIGRDEVGAPIVFYRRDPTTVGSDAEKRQLEQGSLAEYYQGISEGPVPGPLLSEHDMTMPTLSSDEEAPKRMLTPTVLLAACTLALISVLLAASAIPSAVTGGGMHL
jgi:hypothetical protein